MDKISLEIHFQDKQNISIKLDNTLSSEKGEFLELYMFCCYVLRQIVNLGNGPALKSLKKGLEGITSENIKTLSISDNSTFPKLVEYQNTKNMKSFYSELFVYDDGRVNFQHNTKGFGFFASEMDYYVAVSTIALMKCLAIMNKNSERYLQWFAACISSCSKACDSNTVTLGNQTNIAFQIANASRPQNKERKEINKNQWKTILKELHKKMIDIGAEFVILVKKSLRENGFELTDTDYADVNTLIKAYQFYIIVATIAENAYLNPEDGREFNGFVMKELGGKKFAELNNHFQELYHVDEPSQRVTIFCMKIAECFAGKERILESSIYIGEQLKKLISNTKQAVKQVFEG